MGRAGVTFVACQPTRSWSIAIAGAAGLQQNQALGSRLRAVARLGPLPDCFCDSLHQVWIHDRYGVVYSRLASIEASPRMISEVCRLRQL